MIIDHNSSYMMIIDHGMKDCWSCMKSVDHAMKGCWSYMINIDHCHERLLIIYDNIDRCIISWPLLQRARTCKSLQGNAFLHLLCPWLSATLFQLSQTFPFQKTCQDRNWNQYLHKIIPNAFNLQRANLVCWYSVGGHKWGSESRIILRECSSNWFGRLRTLAKVTSFRVVDLKK